MSTPFFFSYLIFFVLSLQHWFAFCVNMSSVSRASRRMGAPRCPQGDNWVSVYSDITPIGRDCLVVAPCTQLDVPKQNQSPRGLCTGSCRVHSACFLLFSCYFAFLNFRDQEESFPTFIEPRAHILSTTTHDQKKKMPQKVNKVDCNNDDPVWSLFHFIEHKTG